MQHETMKPVILVEDVDLTFEDIYSLPYMPEAHMDEIRQANLLLLPSEEVRENLGPIFPETTTEFYYYLKDNQGDSVKADIAVSDEEYHRLLLHIPLVPLATMAVKADVFPQTASLVTDYLNDFARRHFRDTDDLNTIVNFIVELPECCRKIMYRGPISELHASLKEKTPELFK